jgi:hypothetical protein
MHWLTASEWSPYAVGAGIGVLSWIAFILSDKPIGCSTAFTRTSGMIERLFRKQKVDANPYYQKFKPAVDWEWMLVLGIVIGACASAALSGEFRFAFIPDRWLLAAGDGVFLRGAFALAGGIAMGFGARWAGGCTSGHGISGTMQLALSGWLAAMSFFAGGIVTAWFVYNVIF